MTSDHSACCHAMALVTMSLTEHLDVVEVNDVGDDLPELLHTLGIEPLSGERTCNMHG